MSANVSRSFSKNNTCTVFLDTVYILCRGLTKDIICRLYTGDDPGILGAVHLLFVRLAEDDSGFVFIEVPYDDSYAVLLQQQPHTLAKRDAWTTEIAATSPVIITYERRSPESRTPAQPCWQTA